MFVSPLKNNREDLFFIKNASYTNCISETLSTNPLGDKMGFVIFDSSLAYFGKKFQIFDKKKIIFIKGSFSHQQLNGEGIVFLSDGSFLIGKFKKGHLEDFFKVYYSTGDLMMGTMKKNEINVLAFFFSKNRKMWHLLKYNEGIYEKTILVQDAENDKGVHFFLFYIIV